jgi:hypothetical protein
MNAKRKSNSVVTHSMQDGKIVFDVIGAGKLVFDPDKVSAQNRARAMIHGFVQRISDGAARLRNPETGASAPASEKLAMMQRIAEHLMSGSTEWNLKVAAPKGPDSGTIVLAMIRALAGVNTPDEAEALLTKTIRAGKAADRDGALKVWAATSQVREAVKLIEAERARGAGASADDLLAELAGFEVGDDEDEGEADEGDEAEDEEAPM